MNKDRHSNATLTPVHRQAALKAAAVLARTTLGAFADECGVSYNHFSLVVRGERVGSAGLEEKIAAFLDRPRRAVFPPRDEREQFK